jgi:ATP-dependent Clp protease ATP-binding subunit ClpB
VSAKQRLLKRLLIFYLTIQKKMIRIDMSEYMEKHAVARLIGAPPGYVGYEEGGQLTEQVRRNPYSVLLFDEIEKAHPDVINIFLQILDEGHLTDGQGRTVSFKNCVLIMTSNVGSEIILQAGVVTDEVKQRVEQELHKIFRPEFLNRIDAIVFFRSLTKEDVTSIAALQLEKIIQRLKNQNITLHVDAPVIEEIAHHGYVPEFGARPLARAIQQYILVPISQYLLVHPQTTEIRASLEKGQIVIR